MAQTNTAADRESDVYTQCLREWNERLYRMDLTGNIGMTAGVHFLPPATKANIVNKIQEFTDSAPENDAYGEYDFGAFIVDGHKVFWKVDWHALNIMGEIDEFSGQEPSHQVLTIMLASEL